MTDISIFQSQISKKKRYPAAFSSADTVVQLPWLQATLEDLSIHLRAAAVDGPRLNQCKGRASREHGFLHHKEAKKEKRKVCL
ncbi:MAG TPA: hypothetical protein VFV28_04900 [Limnobacter sp.]|nr:hypothetical protein [Limnobacter sp.]